MRDVALVVLARAPERGRVKTRLASSLGDDLALHVYRNLLAITARAVAHWQGPVLLATTGAQEAFADSGLEGLPRCQQADGGLERRLAAALRAGLGLAPRVLVIGSDCPGLGANDLQDVAALLDAAPVAFGPATDGGFWAIATREPAVATAIAGGGLPWSTPDTLAVLRAQLAAQGLQSQLGPMLSDCDTRADFESAVAAGLLTRPGGPGTATGGHRAGPAVSPRPRVAVVIPVLDEEAALPLVLAEIPADLVDDIVVVDNGSVDRSAEVARAAGARVVHEPRRGYGAACLAGISATPDSDVVVFLDGDHSDYPADLRILLPPLVEGAADLVIGSRMLQSGSRAALLPQARFGNRLASLLLRLLFGIRCTDLGPFRAIRRPALLALGMQDRDFGWTVEMQLRARLCGLRVLELPVRYRRRIGQSKISGTLGGTVRAGYKILRTIAWYRLRPPRPGSTPRP